ncbi:MAG: hypothetical protein H8K06_00965 [Nitrospira sp.]|nr:hypothetical protein [Nitrospira sp.]
MYHVLHLTPAAYYLLLGWLLFNQTSCITVTDRVIPGPTLRQESAVTSQGAPEAHHLIHPDHQGWTVSLTQPLLRHVETVRSERKEQHSYYPNPFAIPAGMFACPSSVWGWFWGAVATIPDPTRQLEQRKALVDFTFTSCLMALSIVRTDPIVKDVETVVEHKLEPDSRPLTEGRVTLSWQGTREVSVPYPVTADGRAIVRLSHLATALQHHEVSFTTVPRGRIELVAWHRDQVLRRWPVEVTAEQLEAAVQMETPVMAPRSRWPRSLVFKIAMESLPVARPDPVSTVQELLVQRGLTVVASEAQQPLVRRELEQNLTGLVEDDLAIGPGHWRAATVLVLITGFSDANQSGVSISCVNVQTRELLARLDVTAGPEGFSGALDVLATRFQNLLRHLPSPTVFSGR